MKTTEINSLAKKLKQLEIDETANIKGNGTFKDFYRMVLDGVLLPVTDENDNIVAFQGKSGSTGIDCAKLIGGNLTVGKNESERVNDEKMYKQFMEYFSEHIFELQSWFNLSLKFKEAGIRPENVILRDGRIFIYDLRGGKILNKDGDVVARVRDVEDLHVSRKILLRLFDAELDKYLLGADTDAKQHEDEDDDGGWDDEDEDDDC